MKLIHKASTTARQQFKLTMLDNNVRCYLFQQFVRNMKIKMIKISGENHYSPLVSIANTQTIKALSNFNQELR